jgi:hypothetical protein
MPAAETPITPLTGIDTVELVVVAERPIVIVATTPLAIVLAFMPFARHCIDPAAGLQLSVLPVPVRADPPVTLTVATSPAG